ncbi:Npun_F0296 family exosortase-dependent surface protein [Salinisphaera sp. RV14]|uniref:Npun_F0296 family exosortase-dependent surface protein n=1 Tax=unclassified Salinisphaera TaxID=2649847 RepID=UPI003F86A4A5
MNKQKKLIFASAIAALAISGTAGANVIYGTSTVDGDGVPTPINDVANVHVINFNDGTCGSVTCGVGTSNNYHIVNGSVSGKYAAPAIPPFTAGTSTTKDKTDYLAVPKDLSTTPQSATIALGSVNHYLGLLWGSIDNYNTLDFLFNGSTVASFNGININSQANGNQVDETNNAYVNFFQLPAFDSVKLTSTQYAFEIDNLAYSDVPEPGNLVLFGLGALALLVGFRGRFSGRAS